MYQRWIYKVDNSRVNEFGFSGEMEDKSKNTAEIKENELAITDTDSTNHLAKSVKKKDKKRD